MGPKSTEAPPNRARSYVAVIGHGPLLEREDGASATLRQLGATVRTLDLWDDPAFQKTYAENCRHFTARLEGFRSLPNVAAVRVKGLEKDMTSKVTIRSRRDSSSQFRSLRRLLACSSCLTKN